MTQRTKESLKNDLKIANKRIEELTHELNELKQQETLNRSKIINENQIPFENTTKELEWFFSYSIDLLCIASLDGRFKKLNPQWEATLGYAIEELLDKPFLSFVHPEDQASTIAEVSVLKGKNEVNNFVNRYRCKDGTYRFLEWRSYPAENQIFAVARDVTQREEAVKKLSESESMFRSLFENMMEGVALHDVIYDEEGKAINYRIVDTNPAFEKHTGLKHDDSIGKLATDLYQTETAPYLEIWCNVAETGVPDRIETYFPPMEKHFQISIVSPRRGRFATVFEDITEQKNTTKALMESEARLESILRAAPIGIGLIKDRKFHYVNETVCKLFDYKMDDLLGKSTSVLYGDKEEYDRIGREIYPQLEIKDTVQFETIWKRRNGEPVDVVMSVTDVVPGDYTNGVTFTVLDISSEKKSAQEKEKLEQQLQQAMKMEAVGRLAGGIAHDFNNLLTAIMGNLDLALMDLSHSDPLYNTLDEIRRTSSRAGELTHQLLAFSRKQMIEPRIINLDNLIENVHSMLQRLIGEDVELKRITDTNLKSVKIDPGQFEQILVNLAVNARDAMPDGGSLIIETKNIVIDEDYSHVHQSTKVGEYVLLQISDTGQGMCEDVKNHIFEPFYTTKSTGQGTGLGLATTYGIVKQAEGSIEVYSEEGHGTTFKIYLPVSSELDNRPIKTKKTGDLKGKETILLVEDEHLVRNMAVRILEKYGYRVLSAGNGGEAFMIVESMEEEIDLMVTDVIMPGINGRELAERIAPLQPQMKVLYTSGYTENIIVHHGIVETGLNFISKPYSPKALAQKVYDLLHDGE